MGLFDGIGKALSGIGSAIGGAMPQQPGLFSQQQQRPMVPSILDRQRMVPFMGSPEQLQQRLGQYPPMQTQRPAQQIPGPVRMEMNKFGSPIDLSGVEMHPGELAERYEIESLRNKPLSDKAGYISGGASWDPGGTSYGPYQLSLKAGNVKDFVSKSQFADEFQGLRPGTTPFNNKWREVASQNPQGFIDDQFEYIKGAWFNGALNRARDYNIPVDNEVIQSVVFSISNQHGGYRKIFKDAKVKPDDSLETAINKLYDSRARYINSLKGSKIEPLKPALIKKRTIHERQDALNKLNTGDWYY